MWLKISCIPHLFILFALAAEYKENIKLYLIKRNLAGYPAPSATVLILVQNIIEHLPDFLKWGAKANSGATVSFCLIVPLADRCYRSSSLEQCS